MKGARMMKIKILDKEDALISKIALFKYIKLMSLKK